MLLSKESGYMPTVSKCAWNNPYYALGKITRLAPGVLGHLIDAGHKGVYIPTILSEKEGKGNVGAFIDKLKETYPLIRFPNVMNPVLEDMLKRRGFIKKREYVPFLKCHADVYVWKMKVS
jgi:hypothetical protein